MIEAILSHHLKRELKGLRVLDIGCGNGEISGYLASRGTIQHGVDILDQRRYPEAPFEFRLTDSERLPYDDRSFDIVISHHVIEHVEKQALHLTEIRRVLDEAGIGYLATPNKTSPIMEGHVGNDRVLTHSEMKSLFEASGFAVSDYSAKVAGNPDEFFSKVRWARFLPDRVLDLASPLFPSRMFILLPDSEPAPPN